MTEEGPLASAPREIMKCANSTGAGRRLNDGDQGVRKEGLSEKEDGVLTAISSPTGAAARR